MPALWAPLPAGSGGREGARGCGLPPAAASCRGRQALGGTVLEGRGPGEGNLGPCHHLLEASQGLLQLPLLTHHTMLSSRSKLLEHHRYSTQGHGCLYLSRFGKTGSVEVQGMGGWSQTTEPSPSWLLGFEGARQPPPTHHPTTPRSQSG